MNFVLSRLKSATLVVTKKLPRGMPDRRIASPTWRSVS
jgi:hypothetical protein